MDSVLDFLFLRRLKFNYTCPPICPITPASGSGLSITGQVISPILAMQAPAVSGQFLTWPCDPGQVCYNIYFNNGGLLSEMATCIQPNTIFVCSSGCWQSAAVVGGIEGPLTAPICTDGSEPVSIPLPASANVEAYHVYKDSTLVLAGPFCAAYETCTLGCYSITAITGDGETPPSPPACNGGNPIISITSPANGTIADLPYSTSIVAAVDTHGHTPIKVEFFDGATSLGVVAGPGPYSLAWSPATDGAHVLTAVLTYDAMLTSVSSPVTVTTSLVLPGQSDLLQWLESSQFDSTPDGTSVYSWTDLSGNGNHMTHVVGPGGISGNDLAPVVDTASSAGGHPTLRFTSGATYRSLTCPLFIPASGLPGLEIIVVYKNNVDPVPTGQGPVFGYTRTYNIFVGSPFFSWASEVPNQPVGSIFNGIGTPTHFEEPFANGTNHTLTTGNLSLGYVANPTSFTAYGLSADAGGGSYKAWMNANNFFSVGAGGYTFVSRGAESQYTLGGAALLGFGAAFSYTECNIAAVFLWGRQLTADERSKAWFYIQNKYGITF